MVAALAPPSTIQLHQLFCFHDRDKIFKINRIYPMQAKVLGVLQVNNAANALMARMHI